MSESVEMMIPKDEIEQKIAELGRRVTEDYAGKDLTLVCVLKGGVVFMADLARQIGLPVEFDFIDVSSYGSAMESNGVIKINKDLENPIAGKDVLLTEDIIDSGNTLSFIIKHLQAKLPRSLRVCAFLDKPGRRTAEGIEVDYVGFTIPDRFVVGYGLDYDQRYRNLPYVGVLKLT